MRSYNLSKNNLSNLQKTIIPEEKPENLSSKSLTNIVRKTPVIINSFEELIVDIADLSNKNPDVMLLYRGQKHNFKESKYPSLYPSIYRGSKGELTFKFDVLKIASSLLVEEMRNNENIKLSNNCDLYKIDMLQHAILQHYEVCDTPYLDLTQSLQVACSFAGDINEECFLYVIALPYITGRISINSV